MLRTCIVTCVVLSCAALALGQDARIARDCLGECFAETADARATLGVLAVTGDKDLLPLFLACARSKDKDFRLFAVQTLADLDDPQADRALRERVQIDPAYPVRGLALFHLLRRNAVTTAQLQDALLTPDDYVRCLASVGLIRAGKGNLAAETLDKLTASTNPTAVAIARMCLLQLGHQDQLVPLRKLLADEKTPDELAARMLSQITEEKISAAYELARQVAESDRVAPLRVRAYEAMATLSPRTAETLLLAIGNSNNAILRAHLLEILSRQKDSQTALKALATGGDGIAALARFELARPAGGADAARAALAALIPRDEKDEHQPADYYVVRYVLLRAEQDIKARGEQADFYTPALAGYIRAISADTEDLRQEHLLAARATTLLADLGTPEAMKELKELLRGRYDARLRVVAAGLRHTANRQSAALAKALLDRPYEDIVLDATLALGKTQNPDAETLLARAIRDGKRNPPAVRVLASWYLLKLRNQAQAAAAELAEKLP